MKFRFYSAAYLTEDNQGKGKSFNCRQSDIEFNSLEEATEFMKDGAICQCESKVSFIPVVCEQLDEVVE